MSERIFLGGLWGRDTKAGHVISGPFGKARLVIFGNKRKAKESDPDYYAYIEEPQKRDDRDDHRGRTADPSEDW